MSRKGFSRPASANPAVMPLNRAVAHLQVVASAPSRVKCTMPSAQAVASKRRFPSSQADPSLSIAAIASKATRPTK